MNLNQITIPSLDLTKSIPFYEKLGLKLIVKSLPHYARFECPVGKSTFSIHQTENLPTGDGIYIYFECDNLEEYVNELKEKGIQFDQEPTDQRWLWREARLRDIDGNQLILFYGGENRLNPPWRIEKQLANKIKIINLKLKKIFNYFLIDISIIFVSNKKYEFKHSCENNIFHHRKNHKKLQKILSEKYFENCWRYYHRSKTYPSVS